MFGCMIIFNDETQFLKLKVASVFSSAVLGRRSNQIIDAVISAQEMFYNLTWYEPLIEIGQLNRGFKTYDSVYLTKLAMNLVDYT